MYPLHDGDYRRGSGWREDLNDRKVLYMEWASLTAWSQRQPMWLIKKYFGPKIAMYFAWLEFYTQALVPPAILGILCMLYAAFTFASPLNAVSQDICSEERAGNLTMCPVCDQYCTYWKLKDSCILSQLTYFFDNNSTIFFAIFMSFWATMFLEVWKRKQAILQWEWDLGQEDYKDPLDQEYKNSSNKVILTRCLCRCLQSKTKKRNKYLN